jgi:hypothetical protein
LRSARNDGLAHGGRIFYVEKVEVLHCFATARL